MTKNIFSVSLSVILALSIAAPSIAQTGTVKVPAPSVIMARKEVPILCYHQVRDWKPTDSKNGERLYHSPRHPARTVEDAA